MGKSSKTTVQADKNIGLAALKSAEQGDQLLAFMKSSYKDDQKRQAAQDILSNQVTQQQLDASKQSQQWATEDRERYKSVYQPLQDEFIDQAKSWDSAARQNTVAAEAKADVMNNANLARQSNERNMASMGVSPTSGRYAGVERATGLATGLAAAGAENTARNTVRNQAVAMKADAVNMGNGLAVNPATSLGLSSSTGSAAYGTTAANNAQAAGLANKVATGYQGSMNGYGQQASILNSKYQNDLSAWNTQQQANSSMWSGIGSLAGMGLGAMMLSTKEAKEDMQPVDGALDVIENLPVEQWKYKDGQGDGAQHIGTYAEDFHAQTGLGDGKSIPVVDGIGLTMKAIQELSAKVDGLVGKGKAKGKGLSVGAA